MHVPLRVHFQGCQLAININKYREGNPKIMKIYIFRPTLKNREEAKEISSL
jgi:hypothetical protein